jgi:outer membrane protein OmpA-like peptidoglycan-associated protein
MKRYITILAISVLSIIAGTAQPAGDGIEATDIRMTQGDKSVSVSFTLNIGDNAVGKKSTLVITPKLEKGDNSEELTPIAVIGKRAGYGVDKYVDKNRWYHTTNGGAVKYSVEIPYAEWMRGAKLTFDGARVRCGIAREVAVGVVADDVLNGKPTIKEEIIRRDSTVPAASNMGEYLSEEYSFVSPMQDMPHNIDDMYLNSDARDGSLSVYFRQGSSMIERSYMANGASLDAVVSVIKTLLADKGMGVIKAVIAGFASPEGATAVNDRLAKARVKSIVNYLSLNSGMDEQDIAAYNGAVDWRGLRELVAQSSMVDKQQVLDIIDTKPIWNHSAGEGRLGALMRLNGGNTYRYILKNMFPKLRQVAFIRVYYQERM